MGPPRHQYWRHCDAAFNTLTTTLSIPARGNLTAAVALCHRATHFGASGKCTLREVHRMPSRRRLLKMFAGLSAVGVGGWALLRGTRANAYYQGPISDHFDGTRFFNPDGAAGKGLGAFLKWQFTDRGAAWPKSYP